MPVRSMTGYAQLTHQVSDRTSFSLSLKSVNHRFLDLHFRIPLEANPLELKMRRILKEKIARGHIEVALSLQQGDAGGFQLNHALVEGYVRAFQEAAERLGIVAQPDLNVILRTPGALSGDSTTLDETTEQVILEQLEQLIERLNHMREEEGRGVDRELRERMEGLSHAVSEIGKLRALVSRAYLEKVQSRMDELIAGHVDPDRVLQEAAMLAERSDIQEEVVRLENHIKHFYSLLDCGGEAGKKLDFLLQELNREANTLLSKTAGVAGEGLRITELGLLMKSEIEKAREQVQNVE
ncbi:MAG: YicC family protein [Acidobacteria bacterium]|nr:MAG: YicC family protein [Acidobacteriota bacterium]PYY23606.1 MAG: YicC family protein [Acidobacteriota bacterium]